MRTFEHLLGWECENSCHTTYKQKEFTLNSYIKKQVTGMQGTFILEINLQRYIFYQNRIIFSATYASILKPCWYENLHWYATTKELKKKPFTIHSQNLKQTIGVQVNFIFELKLPKNIF